MLEKQVSIDIYDELGMGVLLQCCVVQFELTQIINFFKDSNYTLSCLNIAY